MSLAIAQEVNDLKEIITTWSEADVGELSDVAGMSNPLLAAYDADIIKSHLANINKRFPSDFLIEARDDDRLLGWLTLRQTTETMGEMGRWQPHILDGANGEEVFKNLLRALMNHSVNRGISRVEVGYGEVSAGNLDVYNRRARWLEEEAFWKLEDSLFLSCSLADTTPVAPPLPEGIDYKHLSEIGPDSLFSCYKACFSVSEHREFFDYSERQIREAFEDYFDLTVPFNKGASLVLTRDGEVIGFSLVRPRPNEEHLEMFGLLPDYRGRGIAKALLSKSMRTVLDQGTERMSIGVDAVNRPAVKLYKKAGFKLISQMITHSWKSIQ